MTWWVWLLGAGVSHGIVALLAYGSGRDRSGRELGELRAQIAQDSQTIDTLIRQRDAALNPPDDDDVRRRLRRRAARAARQRAQDVSDGS